MKTMKHLAAAVALLLALAPLPSSATGLMFDFTAPSVETFPAPRLSVCLTDLQVRAAIDKRGYTDITLAGELEDGIIKVRGTTAGSVWLVTFDRCRDQIVERLWLRPAA